MSTPSTIPNESEKPQGICYSFALYLRTRFIARDARISGQYTISEWSPPQFNWFVFTIKANRILMQSKMVLACVCVFDVSTHMFIIQFVKITDD